MILVAVATLSLSTWAYAADQQGSMSTGSPSDTSTQKPGDSKIAGEQSGFPNPAFPKVEGKLSKIEGDSYTIQDSNGQTTRLFVDDKTKKDVNLKLGDEVTAERTIQGYAKSIEPRK
jgi:hypothetical protein